MREDLRMNSSPFRRACGRFFRYAAWTGMIVFILVSSVYVYLDWKAEKRWAAVQAMVKREGETLALTDLMPPRLPEAENYAAIPELRGINIVEDGNDKKGTSAAKRQALLDLVSGLEKITPKMYQEFSLGRPPDWPRLMAELKSTSYITDLPPAGKEAELFKRTLETKRPLLKVLAESSHRYQQAEWVPALRDQTLPKHLMELKVPHYNAVQMTCRALTLHAIAAAESGDARAALDDYRAISLLTRALDREPLLIGHLVSLVSNRYGFEVVWSLLRLRGLQETDVASLQTLLSSYEPEKSYLLSLRGELFSGLNSLDALATDLTGMGMFSLAGATGGAGGFRSWMGRAVPDSFFTESGASWVELLMEHFIRPMKSQGSWAVVQQQDALDAALGSGGLFEQPFDRFFARYVLSTTKVVAQRTLHMEALRRQALVACALERCLIKQGRYPERLEELVPQYLASVPLDPVDQLPLRYRQADSGRYRIWCVGMDGVDDEGQVNPGPGDNPAAILSKPQYQGDWTWQYEPVALPPAVPAAAPKGPGLPPLPGFPSAPSGS